MADLKNTSKSLENAAASAEKLESSFSKLSKQVIGTQGNLEHLAVALGGLTVLGTAIKSTMDYNKTLYDLGRNASVTGQSFGQMRVAIKQLSDSTLLSQKDAAKLYETINHGIDGVRFSAAATRDLSKALADEFGPSLDQAAAAAQKLLNINSRMPGTMALIKSSLPYAEYEKLINAQLSLNKLSVQEAETLLRTKKAYEGSGSATKEQTDKLRELEKVQATLNKQFQEFMLAVGPGVGDVLKTITGAITPFIAKITDFLSKNKDLLTLIMKGAAIKIGVDVASGAAEKLGGLFGSGEGRSKAATALLPGGGNVDSIIGGIKNVLGLGTSGGKGPVEVVIVGDKTGGSSGGLPSLGGDKFDPFSGKGPGPEGILGKIIGKAKSLKTSTEDWTGNLISKIPGSSMATNLGSKAMALAGKYKVPTALLAGWGGSQLGDLASSLGTDTTGGKAASTGAAALNAGAAGSMLGPQAAALSAAFIGGGEAGTHLWKSLGLVSEGTGSFTEELSNSANWLKTWATEGADAARKNQKSTDIERNVTKEQTRRNAAIEGINKKAITEAYSNLTPEQMASLGITGGKKGLEQFTQMSKERFGEGKVITADDMQKVVSSKEEADALGLLKEKAGLREEENRSIDAQLTSLQTAREYATQYGGSIKDIVDNIDKAKNGLADQTKNIEKNLEAAVEVTKQNKNALAEAKATGATEAALIPLERAVAVAMQNQNELQGKQNTLKKSSKEIEVEILKTLNAGIQARSQLISYAARFEGGQGQINKLIGEQMDFYQQELDAKDKQIAAVRQELGANADVSVLLSERSKIATEQRDAAMHVNDGLRAQRELIGSNIDLAQSELELSESLYGGLGQSLELRGKLFDELQRSIEATKEMIKNQKVLADSGDIEAKKKLVDLEKEQLGYQKKQVELTKSMRDGYLDALTTFSNVEGMFSKITVTREQNLGAAIRQGFAAGSMTTGVMGAGGTTPIAKFLAGGAIQMQNQRELQQTGGGYENAYEKGPYNLRMFPGVGKGTHVEDVRTAPIGTNFPSGQVSQQENLNKMKNRILGATGQEAAERMLPGSPGDASSKLLDVAMQILKKMDTVGSGGSGDDGAGAWKKAADERAEKRAANAAGVGAAGFPNNTTVSATVGSVLTSMITMGIVSAKYLTSGEVYMDSIAKENESKKNTWLASSKTMDETMSSVDTSGRLGGAKGVRSGYAEGTYAPPSGGRSGGTNVNPVFNITAENINSIMGKVYGALTGIVMDWGGSARAGEDHNP